MKQSFGQKGAGGRFLALVLALIMLCSVLPLSYAAAVDEQGTAEQTAETKVEAAAACITYIFYVNGEKTTEVTVPSGSTLERPADPAAPEGKIFKGWFVDNDVNKPFTFGTTVSTTQDETVALYAHFEAEQPAAAQQPEASKTDDVQQPAEQQPEQTGSTEAPKQDETNNTDANTPTGGEENKGEEPTGTENNENQTGENPGENQENQNENTENGGETTTPAEPTVTDPTVPAEPQPTEGEPAEGEAETLTEEEIAAFRAKYDTIMAMPTETDEELLALNEQVQALADTAKFDQWYATLSEEEKAAFEEKVAVLNQPETLENFTGTLTITDTITTNGRLTVSASGETRTLTYTWEKSTDGTNWETVTRKRVTGDEFNVAEDGSWVNVAIDDGARCYYRAKVATIGGVEVENSSYSDSTQVTYYDALQNGGFETPSLTDGEVFIASGEQNIVWQTTEDLKQIEVLYPQYSASSASSVATWHGVVNVAEGTQCAEINANGAGALYQDVLTVPGSTMHWQLAHLGRSMNGSPVGGTDYDGVENEKTDTMYVLIMPYESAKNITTQSQVLQVLNNLGSYKGASVETITYTWKWKRETTYNYYDSTTTYTMQHKVGNTWTNTFTWKDSELKQIANPWEVHSGSYKVPEEQYLTRYFFVAGNTAYGENDSVGNHIDNVWFSTEVPPANPGSANLTIKKTIVVDGWDNMTETERDVFKNSVSFTYNGNTIQGSGMDWLNNVGTYTFANQSLGAYEVTETVGTVGGYTCTTSENDKTQTVTLTDGGTATAAFTNTYTRDAVKITVKKIIEGKISNPNAKFEFKYSIDDTEALETFTLGNNETHDIEVEPNAKLIVWETDPNGYDVYYKVGDATDWTSAGDDHSYTIASVTAEDDGKVITFRNLKDINPDTGLFLDSWPYLIAFALVTAGAVLTLAHWRRRDVD